MPKTMLRAAATLLPLSVSPEFIYTVDPRHDRVWTRTLESWLKWHDRVKRLKIELPEDYTTELAAWEAITARAAEALVCAALAQHDAQMRVDKCAIRLAVLREAGL